ncbi:hypothetical protein LTS18_000929, partial [Coniosporium uncinatum]
KKAQTGEEFNLVDWLNFTTFDIIGDLAFGEPFGCLRDGKFHDWVSLIFNSVKGGAMEQVTRRFAEAGSPLQNWLVDNFVPKRLKKIRKEHLVRSTEKVRRRMANEKTDHRDFIWYIMRQREKHDLKDEEVIVNGALFIVAGSETTANALSGLMARLLRGPGQRCYKVLVDEIRNRFQKEEDIKAEAVAELKYFQACVEEGLRIHPPVPAGLLRTVPKGGDHIDGNWVPGGASVCVTSWAAAHNPANFVNPDEFIPERWLGDPTYAADNKKGMQPFSLGPRGCIGKHLSYLEIKCILARLLWNFDI